MLGFPTGQTFDSECTLLCGQGSLNPQLLESLKKVQSNLAFLNIILKNEREGVSQMKSSSFQQLLQFHIGLFAASHCELIFIDVYYYDELTMCQAFATKYFIEGITFFI